MSNFHVMVFVHKLTRCHARFDIYDRWIDIATAEREYGVTLLAGKPQANTYVALIVAIAHLKFPQLRGAGINAVGKPAHVLYDAKSLVGKIESDGLL